MEESKINILQNDVNEFREILEKQFVDKYEDSKIKKYDLKEMIARKNMVAPLAQSEKSNDNSKMLAKLRLRKDNKVELCRYDSESRSNPGDSFCEPTQNPEDDIMDKDPRLREVTFSKYEDDLLEYDKKKNVEEQYFEDEQIIKGTKQIEKSIIEMSSPKQTKKLNETQAIKEISTNNSKDISINNNVNSKYDKEKNIIQQKTKITNEDLYKPRPIFTNDTNISNNQGEDNKDLSELHDLIIKNEVKKKDSDISKIIQNSPKSKIRDEEVNSKSSGYRQARKQFQDDLNRYESAERSVNESVHKSKEEDNVIDDEPKLADVKFKDSKLKI